GLGPLVNSGRPSRALVRAGSNPMSRRPRSLSSAAVEASPGHAPDDVVDEVAGPPFAPSEAAAAIALGVLALLISGLMGLLLGALAEEGRLSASGIGLTAMLEALS